MGKAYLLDTNAISKALRGFLSPAGLAFMVQVISETANFSVITRIELIGFVPDDEKTARTFKEFIDQGVEFGLTEPVILQTIAIRKRVRIKLPDAVIAATAIVHDLTLLSDNDKYFLRVPRLKYLNPAGL